LLWEDVRRCYPSEWVIIEAIDAVSVGGQRILQQVTVVNSFGKDSNKALREYVLLHREQPDRELYVVHTNRPVLDIKEWYHILRLENRR